MAGYKLEILKEAGQCSSAGDLTALLRREGITTTQLAAWRKRVELHGSEGLLSVRPGRKTKVSAASSKVRELERRIARLSRELAVAQQLIELQRQGALAESAGPLAAERRARLLALLVDAGERIPLKHACSALGVSRATFYRCAPRSKA
jgi:transposase-like protein